MQLSDPIRYLPGVGEKRAQAFARLGIFCVRDVLYHFPRAYQHRADMRTLAEVNDGEVVSVLLTIAREPINVTLKGRMTLTKVSAFDETRHCAITFFNQGYLKDVLRTGTAFRFYGKVSVKKGICTMASPAIEPYIPGAALPEFYPVYPLSAPLTQKNIKDAVKCAIEKCDFTGADPIPAGVREGRGLMPLQEAFRAIHDPRNYTELDKARERFIFEELFVFAAGVAFARKDAVSLNAPVFAPCDTSPFYKALPFTFTPAQERCAKEITADLTAGDGRPMTRLLSGDVGSGKTVVAALAAYICIMNGRQAALMAPTEILAVQHYNDLKELFEGLGISCALLTGSVGAAAKRAAKAAAKSGEAQLIVGTHALLSDGVEFAELGLVITDEQHRFGVMQRAALTDKGKDVHLLVMSATPIPRTLSLILYGDLALSEIDTLPPGRQRVDTFVVDESYRARLDAFIRKNIAGGGQAYIVCPAVEAEEDEGLVDIGFTGDKPKLKNVTDYTAELRARLPELRIETMYGRMKGAEKERIMSEFAAGNIDVLVSTTVIEVGVNVPRATLMIVENAERFGLAQLHQLRGRVGRGSMKSYCILVSDSRGETARTRLEALRDNHNGYDIAKIDLEIRGPGDFFPSGDGSAKQHGAFDFRLANLCSDMGALQAAADAAHAIAAADPLLRSAEHAPLKARLAGLYGKLQGTIS